MSVDGPLGDTSGTSLRGNRLHSMIEEELAAAREDAKDRARLRQQILPRNIAKLGSRRRAAGYRFE